MVENWSGPGGWRSGGRRKWKTCGTFQTLWGETALMLLGDLTREMFWKFGQPGCSTNHFDVVIFF